MPTLADPPPESLRIALATVGTTGDVRPFVALAEALRAAGHEVTAITWPVHVQAFVEAGFAAEGAGPHADPGAIAVAAEAAAEAGSPGRQIGVLRDFHLVDGAAHYRRLRALLPAFDLVVLHGIHALAHAAALDTGVRFATAVFDPVLLPSRVAPPPGAPDLGPLNRVTWAVLDRMLAGVGRPLRELLAGAGSSHVDVPLFRARSDRLHLVACSPTLVTLPPDVPPATRLTGAWLDRGPTPPLPDALARFLEEGPPPVVVTFGSMGAGAMPAIDDAIIRLAADGRRVVVQGATGVVADGVLPIGPVDHRALFPRAAVVVHHGGAGTTHTVVAAGVPSVVVPHVGDQRYWGAGLHARGLGPAPLPVRNLRGDRLAATVAAAADDGELSARARAAALTLAAEDGAAEAVRRIEAVLAA